ncbi:hypothetical protein CUZ56_00216 [Saezia sanguinis]|uniref:Uncharacterized protein n=1 Tax=Saezia sanguinis TaxID=1965230 RepID=A0A433SG62_9BURK|nr:hypothetical protein [Saezia sanguinis]RUS67739.1 hypothetical protein CUZ56_00216 [Saezia sanguinis]
MKKVIYIGFTIFAIEKILTTILLIQSAMRIQAGVDSYPNVAYFASFTRIIGFFGIAGSVCVLIVILLLIVSLFKRKSQNSPAQE